MATTMTAAQRTHTDKALADLEHTLTCVLTYGVSSSERDQLNAELTDIRSQRATLTDTHPNQAYRWTKAATARTKKLCRKHPQVHATAPKNLPTLQKKHRTTHCTTSPARDVADHSPNPAPGRGNTQTLVLPYTNEHRQLIEDTTALLVTRRAQLHRSARVTTGRLQTAIVSEIQRVDDDLHTATTMSYRKLTSVQEYHRHAAELWKEHGAEALVTG